MVIIFDLDGTLLNTISDLGHACNHALALCGYPIHPVEAYPQLVGNGINRLIERALPLAERTENNVLRVRRHFVPYYDEHNCDYTFPYEGITDLLALLKSHGMRLAVASNKYQAAAEKVVNHYFPNLFDVVLGERSGCPRKPDARIVEDILSALGESRACAIYIGDSVVDVATARNASVRMIACSWGFCSREELLAAQPDAIVDRPCDIFPQLKADVLQAKVK